MTGTLRGWLLLQLLPARGQSLFFLLQKRPPFYLRLGCQLVLAESVASSAQAEAEGEAVRKREKK